MAEDLFDYAGRPLKGGGSMQTAVIPNGAAITPEIDLGAPFENLLIIMPDLTTDTTASIKVAEKSGGTFVTLYGLHFGTPADIAVPKQKASTVPIAGARYLQIAVVNNQGTDRTIYLCGI